MSKTGHDECMKVREAREAAQKNIDAIATRRWNPVEIESAILTSPCVCGGSIIVFDGRMSCSRCAEGVQVRLEVE